MTRPVSIRLSTKGASDRDGILDCPVVPMLSGILALPSMGCRRQFWTLAMWFRVAASCPMPAAVVGEDELDGERTAMAVRQGLVSPEGSEPGGVRVLESPVPQIQGDEVQE